MIYSSLAKLMDHGSGLAEKGQRDEDLARIAAGDDRFFEILVERYEEKLRRYIRRFINCSAEDAQDIVQDVFINAYRNLNGFNPDLSFSSWIYRIAHNQAVSHIRRVVARPTVLLEEDHLESFASDVNLERELGRRMEHGKLRQAIGRLDGKYREVIILRYFEDKSYEEISDILRKPPGSISSLLTRAKRLLLENLRT